MKGILRIGVELCRDRCLKNVTLGHLDLGARENRHYLVPNSLSPASPRPGMI